MTERQFRNADDLLAYARTITEIEDADASETVEWFVAMEEARTVAESFSLKDIAHEFLNGWRHASPIENNPQAIQHWLDTFYEDAEYAVENCNREYADEAFEEANINICDLIEHHFSR